jgi:hypothetical protein
MPPRWLLALIAATLVVQLLHYLGVGGEVVYFLRSLVRHLVGQGI